MGLDACLRIPTYFRKFNEVKDHTWFSSNHTITFQRQPPVKEAQIGPLKYRRSNWCVAAGGQQEGLPSGHTDCHTDPASVEAYMQHLRSLAQSSLAHATCQSQQVRPCACIVFMVI